jgi:hypothetical protein
MDRACNTRENCIHCVAKKFEARRPLEGPRCRWKANTVVNLRFHKKAGDFFLVVEPLSDSKERLSSMELLPQESEVNSVTRVVLVSGRCA